MKIGRLDRRVTIIQPIVAQGTSGEDKITGWEPVNSVSEVWAEKTEQRGNTLVQNDRIVLSQIVDWRIRWRNDLTVSMRIVDGYGQCYSIVGFRESENGRERYKIVTTNLLDNEFYT